MIPNPLFHSKKIIWPSFSFGLLDLLKPDYLKGIDLDNKDSWGVDEWRAYSRYLEESGKSMIESLENKLAETKTELTIQRALASRDPKSSKFREMFKDPKTAKPSKPSLGIFELLSGKPTKKRGPRKKDDSETIQYARLILQIQSEYEAKGQHKTYSRIWKEDITAKLGWRERQILKDRFKAIQNTIPKIKKSR